MSRGACGAEPLADHPYQPDEDEDDAGADQNPAHSFGLTWTITALRFQLDPLAIDDEFAEALMMDRPSGLFARDQSMPSAPPERRDCGGWRGGFRQPCIRYWRNIRRSMAPSHTPPSPVSGGRLRTYRQSRPEQLPTATTFSASSTAGIAITHSFVARSAAKAMVAVADDAGDQRRLEFHHHMP